MELSNYEKTRLRVLAELPQHDLSAAARKFGLPEDEDGVYLTFVGRNYRIGKTDGSIRCSDDGFAASPEAGFDETLAICDLLLDSAPDCAPTGVYCRLGSLPAMTRTASAPTDDGLTDGPAAMIQTDPERFCSACERLGGERFGQGDLSYRVPIFQKLCAQLQFWFRDEEYPPQLNILWDSGISRYVRYETAWYIRSHLLRRLREEMERSL